jgi:hypothetical protein
MRLAIFTMRETGESLAVNPENIIVRQLGDEVWLYSCGSSFIVSGVFADVIIEANDAMNYVQEEYQYVEEKK